MDSRLSQSDVIALSIPSIEAVLENISLGNATTSRPMAEWRDELEAVRKEGFEAGVKHARTILDREMKEELERSRRNNELLDIAIRGLHQTREQQFSLELADIVRFAIDLAQRILRTEIDQPFDRIRQIVEETAESAEAQETFLVKVAAENLDEVNEALIPKLVEQGLKAVAIVGEGFGPRDLVVESGARVFDARIDTAFERVVNELGSWHHDS